MKINNKQYLFLFFAVLLLSSCMTTRQVNYFQTGGNIPQYADSVAYQDYLLQKGDYLFVRVYSIRPDEVTPYNGPINLMQYGSDNSTARLYMYLVEEDGCIDYPYIGKMQVLGKSVREVKFLFEEYFSELISDFSVDVRLVNRTFSIIGESGSGRYQIPKEKLTIFQALAMFGDLSQYSDRTKVQLIRQTTDSTVVKTFDLRPKSIIHSEYYYIQPNDVLYIQFSNAKYFGINHFTQAIGVTLSTASFGLMLYNVGVRIKEATEK
ncbi:MAG: polysaccharide biosynthesis/export family protein [Prevotellaceae bacterium]|jgi:polysaccharide export outer membrane protein|nr:polysaccharide biosynthesis/export family protein [Prevotellaceae bacterium]